MTNFLKKPFRWTAVFTMIMVLAVTFLLLDTFVIPRAGTTAVMTAPTMVKTVPSAAATSSAANSSGIAAINAGTTPVVTTNSYQDANIKITIDKIYKYNTYLYVADIQVSSIDYLKTAFAKNTYGRNFKETTSSIAESSKAIFAINGDYYGFRDYGFVLRNGVLYRTTARKSGSDEALVIDSLGNFSIINESQTSAQTLANDQVWQVLSFGPALINDVKVTVTQSSEVGQSMASNPRTAIGQVSALHYIFIVSDGRTRESAGLSLLELAQEFAARGCTVAYNLDGGGSSTMWFNGQIINNPVNGNSSSERSVSDIVYLGY